MDRRSRLDLAGLIHPPRNTHVAVSFSLPSRRLSPIFHSSPAPFEAVSGWRVYGRGARYVVRYLVASSAEMITEAIEHA
jgi:hypothetical protein